MSRFTPVLLLFLLVPLLIGCPSDEDIDNLAAADQAMAAQVNDMAAQFQALRDSLRVYLVDGRPGNPAATPPAPAFMSLGEWTKLIHDAFCKLEADVGTTTADLCTDPGSGDPKGKPPPPPPL
jgi:hypothetical protein